MTYKCPECNDSDSFVIQGALERAWCDVFIDNHGEVHDIDSGDSEMDWSPDDTIRCDYCDHVGRIRDFTDDYSEASSPAGQVNRTLIKGIKSVEALIKESDGIVGLHLNGDIANWDELRTEGQFEEWLMDFDEALSEVNDIQFAPYSQAQPDRRYLLQNVGDGYIGNSPVFWHKSGSGYTQWIDEAKLWTKEEAEKQIKSTRGSHQWQMWDIEEITPVAKRTVDIQDLRKVSSPQVS